jgi:hypothetical protein
MSVLKLKVTTSRDDAYLESNFETAGGEREIAQRISDYIQRVLCGNELGSPPSIAIEVQGNQVQATGSFAFSNVPTANDTVLINGVTFTCVNSGATGNQFNKGSTATEAAENLATTINASSTALIDGYVTASAASGTCLITSDFYGLSGNQCTIAEGVDGGSVITVSGARLTGGAEDSTAQTLNF